MNFWDQRFTEPGYKYGTEPNAFLREQATRLSPASSVLVPGDGEGRNGVWLAEQGLAVTSVDNSAVGLKKAGDLAAARGAPPNDWRPTSQACWRLRWCGRGRPACPKGRATTGWST